MNLILRRWKSNDECTIGQLFNDAGLFLVYTLEDVIREVPGMAVAEWKQAGISAIPQGKYMVTITHSKRFNKPLPLLNLVPGFEGVRIHSGNTAENTEGCILTGMAVAAGERAVLESRTAFKKVYDLIDEALFKGDDVWMDIRNP